MNWKKVVAAAPLLFGFTALPASAAVFEFETEITGSGDVCANGSCATLTVVQEGDDVRFTLEGNLATGEFIAGLYGNKEDDPFTLTSGDFTDFGGTALDSLVGVTVAEDGVVSQTSEAFDWLVDLSQDPPRFENGDTLTWIIEDNTLAAVIGAGSDPSDFVFALRVQGLGEGNEGSGLFVGDLQEPPTQNPEPGSLLLLGLGMAGLALMQRRRRHI